MIRTRIKGNGMKAASSPNTEPNFYAMEYCFDDKCRYYTKIDECKKINVLQEKDQYDFSKVSMKKSLSLKKRVNGNLWDQKKNEPTNIPDRCISLKSCSYKNDIYPSIVTPSLVDIWKAQVDESAPYMPLNDIYYGYRQNQFTQNVKKYAKDFQPMETRSIDYMNVCDNIPSVVENSDCDCSTLGNENKDIDTSCSDDNDEYSINGDGLLETGDEVFFEGLKFRYLDNVGIDEINATTTTSTLSTLLDSKEKSICRNIHTNMYDINEEIPTSIAYI